jgi:cell division protein FtsZ
MDGENGELQLKIKIFGVGGGGCNAVDRLAQHADQFPGIEFYAANTDKASLLNLESKDKGVNVIFLGKNQTGGFGAGAKPEVGKLATEESVNEIESAIGDANLVFVAAGMGGGTGTGGAPVVAKIAKEKKILTIGVVTMPVNFEGDDKLKTATAGVEELRKYVDVLTVVSNQRAFEVCGAMTPLQKVFEKADEVLMNSIKGITDIIVNHTFINLDFADICTVIRDKKTAHIGLGSATGENRMIRALRMASNNELLNTTIVHAKYIIVNTVADFNLTGADVKKALDLIPKVVDENAMIFNGFGFDKSLKDEVRVTIIATGLEGDDVEEKPAEKPPETDETPESLLFDKPEKPSVSENAEQKPSETTKFDDFLKNIQSRNE